MATRIVVLAARPGRVRTVIDNPLPYPRDMRSEEFLALVDDIHRIITEVEMPDRAPGEPPRPVEHPLPWEALPDATGSEVMGLLEVLEKRGGRENVFELVADLGREYGKLLNVVNAAELLGLVDTPHQQVVLTDVGRGCLGAAMPARKQLLRGQVGRLRIFGEVLALIRRSDSRTIDEDAVRALVHQHFPYEHEDRMFDTFVAWARYADLLDHDPVRRKLFVESD